MKWIGQHIWDFISRFRSDVYLEDLTDPGSDTDKFLVVDTNNKVGYRTGAEVLSDIGASSESTDLEFNGSTADGVLTYGGAAQIDVESTLTFDTSSGSILNVNGMKLRASSGGSFSYNDSTFTSYIQLPSFETIGDVGVGGIIKVQDGSAGSVSGAALSLEAGDASGTNMDGGDMRFVLGARTGSGSLADFLFFGSNAGAKLATLNDSGLKLDIADQAIIFEGGTYDTTFKAATSPSGSAKTITLPDATGTVALTSDIAVTTLNGTTANGLATYSSSGTLDIESSLTYTNEKLSCGNDDDGEFTITRLTHSDGDGGALRLFAGSATNGQTNKSGGDLKLYGGLGTGAASGGDIQFYSHKRGSSGTVVGTAANIASIQPGTSNTDFIIYEDAGASTDDYYRVRVKANGETLITTNDAAATAAHYTVDTDGDITLDAASGNIYLKDNGGNYTPGSDYEAATKKYVDDQSGWHGSSSTIKILPRDFVANDVGRPLMIEDDSVGSNELFLFSFSSSDAFAYVPIPTGFKATAVRIYGSDAGQDFYVYEGDITSKTITDVATGATSINTEKTLGTEVTSDATNYLIVRVTSDGATDEIHGGRVTIVAV